MSSTTIGKVQANDRDGQTILVQPHRARWLYVKITHEPLYQGREGLQTKPGGKEAVDTVRYEALVKAVSLLRDGELAHGDARDLLKRGWGAEASPAFRRGHRRDSATGRQLPAAPSEWRARRRV